MTAALLAVVAVILATSAALGSVVPGFVVAAIAALGILVPGLRRFRESVVQAPAWEYAGVGLDGKGLELLQDIGARFEYAEAVVEELPAAIGRVDIRQDANRLLWEAAGHAARTSEIDQELIGLRYAQSGSAPGELRAELERTKADHIAALHVIQRSAEDVARAAGEAAAAATLARDRTGSAYELEVVVPKATELVGSRGLDAAKERLRLAAEVWAELDETTITKRAQLDEDRRQQRG